MPKRILSPEMWPTLVRERLAMWGKCIHTQRLQQRITAADLCTRLGVSRTTLRRLEQGDPSAGVGAYLAALLTLGLADQAIPSLPAELWQGTGQRVKPGRQEKGGADAEYF
ncbi:helix-turn-helix domain-containing protein [Massilia sp. DD77]|uniref:helix-turn-helix domain-containing protein n=1 Tax=Massilia sp. DD77 TaxID=3109349 RepID=UPI002FFEDF7C